MKNVSTLIVIFESGRASHIARQRLLTPLEIF